MSDELLQVESVEPVKGEAPPERPVAEREYTIEKAKAQTANLMGYVIVGGFALSALLVTVTGLWGGRITTTETGELLKAIAVVFGTPLGFVLGYYYAVAKK